VVRYTLHEALAETADDSAESLIKYLCDIRNDPGPSRVRELLKDADFLAVSPDPAREEDAKKLIDAIRRSAEAPENDQDAFNLGRRAALRELGRVKWSHHEDQLFRVFPELKRDHSKKYASMAQMPSGDAKGKKPVDRWLTYLGIGLALVQPFLPKTPSIVLVSLASVFAVLIHPVWNFWWIEAKLWRRIAALGMLGLGLITLGCYVWPPPELTLPKTEHSETPASLASKATEKPVTIKPSQVTFGVSSSSTPTPLSDTYMFRISNNSDDDVYAVSFKLRGHSESLSTENFKFDLPKSSQKPIDENDRNASKFGDIGGMDCTDIHGHPVFFRFILHLAPRESREVTLTHINPRRRVQPLRGLPEKITLPGTSEKGMIIVSAELSYFTKTPLPRFSSANLSLSQIYVDETLKCGTMSFILLK
jgi:hypothetical protein